MNELPVTKLSDDQIEEALEHALARGDSPFVSEIVGEIERRGHNVEI